MDGEGICIKSARPVHRSVYVISVVSSTETPAGSPDLSEARYPPPSTHSGDSDADSSITGTREPSPRYTQPAPVGEAEVQAQSEAASSDEEEAAADPGYLVPHGHGRFALRWSRLTTAADNFGKGSAQTESAIIANWLTSGLEAGMNKMGWYLLSSRQGLTRRKGDDLWHYYHHGYYPNCQEVDRPYQTYSDYVCSNPEWERMTYWLTGDPTFLSKMENFRLELYTKTVGVRDEGQVGTSPVGLLLL